MDLTFLVFILLPIPAVSYKVDMPSEVLFKVGDRRTLTCSLPSCPERVTFSWTALEDKPLYADMESKHTQSLLIFENVTNNHENTVVCKATCGKDSKQGKTAIRVYSFQRNPVITGNEHMILGEKSVLTCEVSHVHPSDYLEVELLYEDKVLVSKEGGDGTDSLKISHTFQPSSEDDGKEITCRASLNVEGIPPDERTKETSGHLRVLSAPHNLRISGLTAVSLGSSLTLTCEAEASPKLEFTWTSLKPDGQSVEIGKQREISIRNVTLSDAGVYQCEVSNNLGRQIINVSVVVQAPPMNTIIEASQKTVLMEGDSVSIFCKSDGVPVDRVVLRQMLDSRTTELKSSVGSETSFTFESVKVSDSGFYECTAFNTFGSQSASLSLTVEAAPHNLRISGLTAVSLGSSLTLTCEAEGSPELEFTWTSLKPDGQSVEIGKQREISIRNVTLSDAGVYQCEVSNNFGRQTDNVSVVVQAPPMNTIIEVSQKTVLMEGDSVSIFCKSDGVPVDRVVLRRMLDSRTTELKSSVGSETSFTFESVKVSDSGFYECTAFNTFGSQSASLSLTVEAAPYNLRISGLTAVSLGSSLTLTCEAEGSPELEFTWTSLKPDGQSVEIGKQREISIRNVTLSDAGVYQCEVSNNFGRQTDNVSVVVQAPPMNTIIEASQQTVLKEGQSISIFCKSDGVPVDRVVLRRMLDSRTTELKRSVGSETSFTFESVKVSDSGFYECTAFNKFGSQSASLNLTVEAYLLEVELQPSDAIVAESGSSLTLSCNASGCPQPMFSWKSLGNLPNRGLIKTDGLLSKLFLNPVEVEDEGTYICEVTCGSVEKSKQTKVNVFSFPTSPVVESPGPSLEGEMIRLTCTVLDVFPANFFRIVWTDGERELHSESGMFSSHLQNLTSVLSYRVEAKDQDKLMTCKVLLDMNGVPTAQTVKTASTALSVHYPPRGTRITVIPQGELKEGESVSISCLSDSIPVGRVELIRVVDGIETELMARDGVETSVILTPLELDDSGLYVCKASNRHGSESDSVEIKVKEKRFESPPSWTDFITPAICLGATAALVGIMVYLWRDRKKGSYDLTKCNPDTV
ncbi:vascular cell adhesion protein 1b isoform X2 [Misgurnus anguillicaudatus]|uniref:vascular cell adhesion protein 1b isoform X2 n=1 Tax=Misgurnus anguillicaudatus TaxID=75329 RepID=UPI003CCF9746